MDEEPAREPPDASLAPTPARSDESGRPTLKTIAFMTGLGVTTVSRALKDAPEIGAETRRRVQLVARQVGYRPNRAGVRLRTGKTNVISLVLNTEDEVMGFVSDMIYGISEQLARTPYHLIVTPYSKTNDPLEPVRYIVETGSADGIIISRTEPNDRRVRYMTERGFPFAAHGRTEMGIDHPFHDFDNRRYAEEAVRTLSSLGRQRLALIGPPATLTYHHHVRQGFVDAIEAIGIGETSFGAITTDESIDQIRAHTIGRMRRRDRPNGIVSAAGPATLALVAGIEAAGLTLGQDVDIVSKQSTRLLHIFRPKLYAVHEDIRQAGEALARSVLGGIDGKPVAALQSLSAPPPAEAGPG